jgi:Tol biopolymer transport system component
MADRRVSHAARVAAAALLIVVAAGQRPADAAESVRSRIVFSRLESDGYRLYATQLGSSAVTKLSEGPGDDIQPDVGPGGRIVFARGWGTYPRGPYVQLYIRERDGEMKPVFAERQPYADYSPEWSPDGKRIVFSRANPGGELSPVPTNAAVYIVNADGTGLRALTPHNNAQFPTWAPDGRSVAFLHPNPEGGQSLYRLDLTKRGAKPVRLTKGDAYQPSWSPDGLRIAFTSLRHGGGWQVYVVGSDGRGERRLTVSGDASDKFPTWSPDGKTIVFESTRGDPCPSALGAGCRISRLYRMRSDGKQQRAITDGMADSYPSWS